jgi:hypothetical protein
VFRSKALWLYSSLDIVDGWIGVCTFPFCYFLVYESICYVTRRKKESLEVHGDSVEWVENEVQHVYKGISIHHLFICVHIIFRHNFVIVDMLYHDHVYI